MVDDLSQSEMDGRDDDEGRPVCPYCLTPHDPLQHFCETCGRTVGQLTPYIPFVNIPYNLSIFGPMWDAIWHRKDTSILVRVFHLILIVVLVPVMLVGLLPMLWRWVRKAE